MHSNIIFQKDYQFREISTVCKSIYFFLPLPAVDIFAVLKLFQSDKRKVICHFSVLWIHFHLIIDEVYEHPEILLLSYVTRCFNSLIYHSCDPSTYKKIVKIIRPVWQSLNFNRLKTVMRSLKFRIKIKYKKCSASENFIIPVSNLLLLPCSKSTLFCPDLWR